MYFSLGGSFDFVARNSAVIIIRTELEDEMLKKGLFGYEEYSKEVKYRLIPFVW